MPDDAMDPVTCTIEDGVAVVRIDDGKVNVISHHVIELLHAALDRSLEDATAVAIIGRDGKLSAGFDLTEMTAGIERTQALVGAGGHLLMRVYGHPQPVVLGVTGHALAAGALLALSCDVRIGGDGPAKIGLNETAIGMGLPHYAVELAQARLNPAHLRRGAVQAEIYDAPGAVEAGYLDRVVPAAEVATATIVEARRLGELSSSAYRHTKLALHRELIDRVDPNIDADMAALTAPARRDRLVGAPVVVVGDLAVDDVVVLHGTARVETKSTGSAANTASWLASMGVDVSLIAAVGDDALAAVEAAVTADTTWLHLSGDALLADGSHATAQVAMAAARRHRTPWSVDAARVVPLLASGPSRFLGWIDGCHLLFGNDIEIDALGGVGAVLGSTSEVVVKLGAAGASWTDGSRSETSPAAATTVVDPSGAGDAFDAGFLAARLQGDEPCACLHAGTRAAARAVAQPGARPRPQVAH